MTARDVRGHFENNAEISIVITSYDYSSKLMKRFPHVKWDFLIIDEAHNLRNVFTEQSGQRIFMT